MNGWIEQWFSAEACRRGGIVRRSRYDVEKFASVAEVVAEVKKRDWHVLEIGDQIVVLCNDGDLRVLN